MGAVLTFDKTCFRKISKSRSHDFEVSVPNCSIVLKFDRCLDSKVADGSVKFQSDTMVCSNLVISPQDVTRQSHNLETTAIVHAVCVIGMFINTLRLRQHGHRF